MSRILEADEVARLLGDLPGWSGDVAGISRTFAFPTFPTAITAVDRVAVEAEGMDHHPDIDIRWRRVTFGLSTHSAGGVTILDIELAHVIQRIAADLDAE